MKSLKKFLIQLLKQRFTKIFLFCFLFYKSIFNTYTANQLSHFFISKSAHGNIEYQITKFSLFFGFEIQNLKIQNLQENGGDTIFTASRIAVLYNLPALLFANIKVTEIALEKPKIYLSQKAGVWNFESLLPKSEKVKKVKEEETTSKSETLEEINLYLPLHAFTYLHIDELDFQFQKEDENGSIHAGFENLNFSFLLNTQRFSKLPLNLKALEIIETLKLHLNPNQTLKLHYSNPNETLQSELILRTIIEKSLSEDSDLKTEIRLATNSLEVIQNKKTKNFQFDLGFQCFLEKNLNEFVCKEFHFIFDNDKWISVDAKIKQIQSSTPDVDIKVSESKIILSDLNPLLSALPLSSPFQLGGTLSLSGIQAQGDIDHLQFTGKLNGKNIFYKQESTTHEVTNLNFHFDSELNLSDKAQSTDADILPILEDFQLHDLSVTYNGILVSLNGRIIPKSLVDLSLNVKNIFLEKFSKDVFGKLELYGKITGSKLSYLNVDLKAYLNKLRYKLGRGTSGTQNLDLHMVTTVDLKGGFVLEDLQVDPFELVQKNESSEKSIQLVSHLDLDFKQGFLAKIWGLTLKANMTHLLPTVPVGLKNTISALRNGLGNEVILKGELLFQSENSKDQISIHLGGSLPALELNDLGINLELWKHKDKSDTLEIKNLSLVAFDKKLKAKFDGKFYKPFTPNPPFGDKTGELKGNFTLESEIPRYVLKGLYFEGDIDFNIDLQGRYVKGEIKSQNSNLKIQTSCGNPPCPFYIIKGLYLNLPLVYDLQDTYFERLTEGNKESFIQNYGFTNPSNFKIQAIEGSHPIYPEKLISYVAPTKDFPGISGFIEMKDGFLTIDNLKIHALNGVIFARDIIFNLADTTPENMEFAGVLQIRDIDLKPLLDEKAQEKIDDGKLKADLNFRGSNLTDPIANMDLSFSIFQIGKDFGKSAVNIISPTNLITDFVLNSYSVSRVEVELSKGLVYAKVKFNKSLLNKLIFAIENDELKQERIPLASFLNRAKSELDTYNQ